MAQAQLAIREFAHRLGLTDTDLRALAWTMVVIFGLTALRVATLWLTPLELGPDEAQYWTWSKSLSFGYYTKPPMIAWVIAASTSLCGDMEPCVRMSAPLFHAATALTLFFLARALYGPVAGFWAALAFATLPGVTFSSILMTTDVPLLFFWALALLAFAKLSERRSITWGIVWGVSMGLGLLSKYAMAYAFLGAALAAFIAPSRRRFLEKDWLTGFSLAFLLLLPNLIWNAVHGFATVRHTAANANWSVENLFNFAKLSEFIGGQFLLLGPLVAGLFVAGIVRGWWRSGLASHGQTDAVLLSFTLPILGIVAVQAFISRANANWAAVALIGASVLAAAWAERFALRRWFAGAVGLNLLLGVLVTSLAISPALVQALGRDNDVKRLRGWRALSTAISEQAHAGGFSTILSDDREDLASMLYYARESGLTFRSYVPASGPKYEFHFSMPLTGTVTGAEARKLLYVTRSKDPGEVLNRFAAHAQMQTITAELGGGKTRQVTLYALEPPFQPAWPQLRTPE
jgi:4-amino-4-deoxy-L-arabinose transferase-like glycosyltransferase